MNLYKFIFIVGTIADVGLTAAVIKKAPRTEENLLIEQYFRKRKGPRKLHLGLGCENTKYVMPETYDVGVVKTYPDNVLIFSCQKEDTQWGFIEVLITAQVSRLIDAEKRLIPTLKHGALLKP